VEGSQVQKKNYECKVRKSLVLKRWEGAHRDLPERRMLGKKSLSGRKGDTVRREKGGSGPD